MTVGGARRADGRWVRRVLLLLPALAINAPLLVGFVIILRFSLNSWSSAAGMKSAWTLTNYAAFFSDSFHYRAILTTVQISLVATVISLVLGYPVAYFLTIVRRKRLILFVILLPLLVEALVRVYAWIVLLAREGLVNKVLLLTGLQRHPVRFLGTRTAIIVELLYEILPFMILPIASVLQRLDPALREAAVGLGANRVSAFWRVTLPLSVPGIIAGTFLTFCLGISAVAAPLLLGGGRVPYMSILIDQQINLVLNWPAASAQAVVMLLFVSLLLIVYAKTLRSGITGRE